MPLLITQYPSPHRDIQGEQVEVPAVPVFRSYIGRDKSALKEQIARDLKWDVTKTLRANNIHYLVSENEYVSGVHAYIEVKGSSVTIANLSSTERKELEIYEWGCKYIELSPRETSTSTPPKRVLRNGRAEIRLGDSQVTLEVGPEDPYESGWSAVLSQGGRTPRVQGDDGKKVGTFREANLCECLSNTRIECNSTGPIHSDLVKGWKAYLAYTYRMAAWPNVARDRLSDDQKTRLGRELRIGRLKDVAGFVRTAAAGLPQCNPEKNEEDVLHTLVNNQWVTFDQLAGIIEKLTPALEEVLRNRPQLGRPQRGDMGAN